MQSHKKRLSTGESLNYCHGLRILFFYHGQGINVSFQHIDHELGGFVQIALGEPGDELTEQLQGSGLVIHLFRDQESLHKAGFVVVNVVLVAANNLIIVGDGIVIVPLLSGCVGQLEEIIGREQQSDSFRVLTQMIQIGRAHV